MGASTKHADVVGKEKEKRKYMIMAVCTLICQSASLPIAMRYSRLYVASDGKP